MPIAFQPRKKLIVPCFLYLQLFIAPLFLFCQAPALKFTPLVSSLNAPVDIVSPPDGSGRLFVVEKGGTVRIISGGTLLPAPFLDMAALISTEGERGLLSLAFHPGYAVNRYFFVYYTNTVGSIVVARYQTMLNNPAAADPTTGQVLITVPHPGASNHNGGKLNFGPDGYLYFATGDGGGGGDVQNNAQNGNVLLGKMLRINVNDFATAPPYYSIPADNPFITDPNIADEIYALGLRNPFKWSFDRLTGDMWIADVGQNAWEEVNFMASGQAAGANYGWRCYEATHPYNTTGCAPQANYVSPVFEYDHNVTTGGSSVTGGYVYRGAAFPLLTGLYIMADYTSGNVWLIKGEGTNRWTATRQPGPARIVAFGEGINGELYATSIDGTVYDVQLAGELPLKLQTFTVATRGSEHVLSWKTSSEQNLRQFDVELSSDGITFKNIGSVAAGNTGQGGFYQFSYPIPASTATFYRLRILDNSGKAEYSSIIKPENQLEEAVQIAPTLVRNNRVNIRLNKPFRSVQLIDMNGRVLRSMNAGGAVGLIYLDVSGISKGVYTIRFLGGDRDVFRKVVVE